MQEHKARIVKGLASTPSGHPARPVDRTANRRKAVERRAGQRERRVPPPGIDAAPAPPTAPRPLSARDREIFELRASGWTLREIGERYGISRQRVDEILRDRGGPRLPVVIAARRARSAEVVTARALDMRRWWRDGLSVADIAQRVSLPATHVQQAIGQLAAPIDQAHRNRTIVMRTRTCRYSDQDLLAGLRAVAARVGRTPTQEQYRALARELGLASILTLSKRFGGWHDALDAAGLAALPRGGRRASRHRWDSKACWQALETVADQLGNPPRFHSYVKLSTGRSDLPSGPTVRNQLGRWIDIVIELDARRTAG